MYRKEISSEEGTEVHHVHFLDVIFRDTVLV